MVRVSAGPLGEKSRPFRKVSLALTSSRITTDQKWRARVEVTIVSLAIIALAFLYYFITWQSVRAFVSSIDHSDQLFYDFVAHYYPMAKTLFVQKAPVGGYFYSPFFAILLAPLGLLSPQTAFRLWGALQALAAAALFLIPGIRFLHRSRYLYYFYVGSLVFSVPLLHNLKWGQVSVFVTLLILGTLFLYRSRYPVLAAGLLGVAASVKPYAGIFVLYFVLRRDARFVGVFLAAVVLFALLTPFLAIGVEETFQFYGEVGRETLRARTLWIVKDANSQYFASVVTRVAESWSSISIHRPSLMAVGLVALLANLLLLYRLTRTGWRNEMGLAFALLFTSIPFVVETSWPHYFVFLPFCQATVADAMWDEGGAPSELWKAIVPVLPSALLSSAVVLNLTGHWTTYSHYGFLFLSSTWLTALIYLRILRKGARS